MPRSLDEEAAAMDETARCLHGADAVRAGHHCRLPTGCGVPDSASDKAKSMTKRHQVSFKKALRDGIPIAMGTDAGTPFNFTETTPRNWNGWSPSG